MDVHCEIRSPVLYFEDETMSKAMALLTAKGLIPGRFLVAHPGAKWPPRRWPLLYWRVLIEKLKDDLPYPVLLLGGPEDSAMIHGIAGEKGLSSVASLVSNDTALSSAIMKMATLCVCNDSGAMHIAAAVETPSISLFGPGHPQVSAPPKDDGCQVLYDAMFCSPCSQYYSRTRCRRGLNFCMHAISPERVYCEIEKVVVHKEGEVS
jgi:ADP-heptose:LPS heptosyltransferase